jgi:tRNA/rRNA methyltransferase
MLLKAWHFIVERRMSDPQTNPVVILCRPQMGENIGAAARVMSNFGLTQLRLVSPRDGWPNQRAIDMAANGECVVHNAQVFADLPAALADLNVVYGTSGMMRDTHKPMVEAHNASWNQHKIGLLFGCERSGLTNEELALCDTIIHIRTSAANPSLNLAQAVAIMVYEFSKSLSLKEETHVSPSNVHSTKQQIYSMVSFLESELERAEFFSSPGKKNSMILKITDLLVQANLTEPQANSLFGVFKALSRTTITEISSNKPESISDTPTTPSAST